MVMTARMAPFLTILRLLLVVSGLAALGYAPSLARGAAPGAEAHAQVDARLLPAATNLRVTQAEVAKGDLPDLALPPEATGPGRPQTRRLALVLPGAESLASRGEPAPQARGPPLA